MKLFTPWLALAGLFLLTTLRPAQAQNVGIGTTTPTQTLDVNGALRVRGLSSSGGRLPQVQPDGTLGLFSSPYSSPSDPYAAQPVLLNPDPAGSTSGGTATGDGPFSVAVSGSTAYVVNYFSNNLQVFDVSTPASPVLRGTVSTGSGPYSVAISGSVAYVVNNGSNSLQVFDVSLPTSPVLRGTVATGSFPQSVAVSGSTAYVVNRGSNSLQVFDVSLPTSPVLRSSVATGRASYSVAVSGSTAYVVNRDSNTLQAFQVSSLRTVGLAADGSLAIASPPTLSVSGQSLSISGGNTVTLPTTDPPTLSVSGQSLSISGGNTVTLPGDNLGNHTATQNLNLGTFQLVGNGGTRGVSVSSGGNVGIGTTTPLAALHIDGAEGASTTAVGVTLGGGSSSNPNIELRSVGRTPYIDFAETSGVDFTTRLISQGGTLNVMYGGPSPQPTYLFKVNGGLQCTSLNQTSDARLKTQVRPLTGALASVLALRGVRYRWNALGVQRGGTAGAEQVGLLAQELEQVYPELVSTDAQGYKAVNYAQLTPVLLEALKEQQQQIQALQAQVAAATQQASQAAAAQQADHADLQTLKAQLARLLGEPSQASAR